VNSKVGLGPSFAALSHVLRFGQFPWIFYNAGEERSIIAYLITCKTAIPGMYVASGNGGHSEFSRRLQLTQY